MKRYTIPLTPIMLPIWILKIRNNPLSKGEYNTKDICVPKGKTRTNNVFTPIWHTKARKT
jgi:hypothetical protein